MSPVRIRRGRFEPNPAPSSLGSSYDSQFMRMDPRRPLRPSVCFARVKRTNPHRRCIRNRSETTLFVNDFRRIRGSGSRWCDFRNSDVEKKPHDRKLGERKLTKKVGNRLTSIQTWFLLLNSSESGSKRSIPERSHRGQLNTQSGFDQNFVNFGSRNLGDTERDHVHDHILIHHPKGHRPGDGRSSGRSERSAN